MESIFHNISLWVDSSKYILLFIGTIIEGPVIMLASGFLYHLGQFDLVPMYLLLVFGDFITDIGWYCVGRFGTRSVIFKYGHYIGVTPEKLKMVEDRFNKYHQKILIISKLTMGFGFALVVLIVAGIFKIPFKNYVIINLIGGFFWTAFLITIGYFLGNIYSAIPESIKISFLIALILIIIIGFKFANKYLSTKETLN